MPATSQANSCQKPCTGRLGHRESAPATSLRVTCSRHARLHHSVRVTYIRYALCELQAAVMQHGCAKRAPAVSSGRGAQPPPRRLNYVVDADAAWPPADRCAELGVQASLRKLASVHTCMRASLQVCTFAHVCKFARLRSAGAVRRGRPDRLAARGDCGAQGSNVHSLRTSAQRSNGCT